MGRNESKQRSTWRKTRRGTSNGACIEVAPTDGMVVIRNSKNPDDHAVSYTADEWSAFLEKAKKGEFDNLGEDGQITPSAARRRDQFGTASLRAFLRGLISDATENDEALRLHLKLFRFARSTVLALVAAALVGSLIFGAGIAAAVIVAGVHVTVALSIGAGGSATFVVTAAIRSRRYLRAVLSALSEIDRHDPQSGPKGTHEAGDRRTAA